ncbi:MAG: sortase [Gammaproteobacteria bacterium]|nr:sortase [Gammaproteobacteria bacterium]
MTGWVMMSLGGLLLAFLAYQLVMTNVWTARSQQAAETELAEHLQAAAVQVEVAETILLPSAPPVEDDPTLPQSSTPTSPTQSKPISVVHYLEPAPEEGAAFGRIKIPVIDLDKVIFEGVDRATLKKGPGHMPWTPLPGQPGNAVISGHRTTYGAPFFKLDEVSVGDQIIVETALGRHVYEVREVLIVRATDVWVTDPKRGAWLTLTTCNPRYSARERLIVQAELVDGPNLLYAEAEKDLGAAGAS